MTYTTTTYTDETSPSSSGTESSTDKEESSDEKFQTASQGSTSDEYATAKSPSIASLGVESLTRIPSIYRSASEGSARYKTASEFEEGTPRAPSVVLPPEEAPSEHTSELPSEVPSEAPAPSTVPSISSPSDVVHRMNNPVILNLVQNPGIGGLISLIIKPFAQAFYQDIANDNSVAMASVCKTGSGADPF
ncbi:hypothetical protein WG66_000077 [Moniliophthora roreri]|nr:hypothetical protein WG66_000077 [Moniliophthora roreri]